MKSSKVSPFFMWAVGYLHGLAYFGYFKPNGYYWQWFVFLAVTYPLAYIGWRLYYESKNAG